MQVAFNSCLHNIQKDFMDLEYKLKIHFLVSLVLL